MMGVSSSHAYGMLPQVSVVLPFRDAASWLAMSLASLRKQVGVELELVAVNDGSTDLSLQVIQAAWQDTNWPLRLIHGPARGVSAARNRGWQAASHPLVAFLDADDLACPGRLKAQADLFTADPELQQVLCGWRRIDANGKVLTEVRPWEEGAGFTTAQALRHKAVLPSAWMLRREALEVAGGFDESLSQAEDVDLLLRLARLGGKGEWLREILCDYRVHTQGASQRARDQARGLSYVLERELKVHPASPEFHQLAAEVRYGTRAWLGWYAWRTGDEDLALHLWRTALALSPFPPGLTWVHLAENVVRSADRIGEAAHLDELLRSSLWRQLECSWLRARCQPMLWTTPCHEQHLDWTLIYRGQVKSALLDWARQFKEHACPQRPCSEMPAFDWHPQAIRPWCTSGSPLSTLRGAVLDWCANLLQLAESCGYLLDLEPRLDFLQRQLAKILLLWVEASWPEDRRPTLARLEQSIAVWPYPTALRLLARLQKTSSEAGSRALAQLSLALEIEERASFIVAETGLVPGISIPPNPAFWELSAVKLDQCNGPQCNFCIHRYLHGWRQKHLGHHLVVWGAPDSQVHCDDLIGDCLDDGREIQCLDMGQAWLRAPSLNPWQSTHAYTIASANGVPFQSLSRRYPQPWPNSCPFVDQDPEPMPDGQAMFVDRTVIALIGLSAETYYHWMLEVLPGLGVIEAQFPDLLLDENVLIWHNGGNSKYVRETLVSHCGINVNRIIDAKAMPWIRARRLIVLSPPPFGSPSAASQNWLRQLVSTSLKKTIANAEFKNPPKIVWLWRGDKGRRPVFGEQVVLRKLQQLKVEVEVVDCALLSVLDQAQKISGASLIVAPHGGAMANLVFAQQGTKILELHNPDYSPPYYHSIVCNQNLRYYTQAQVAHPIPALYRDLLFESPATEPIILDPALVIKAVEAVLAS